jgi:hypothetical protein
MNATTTAPTESMFIDMSRFMFMKGLFEDIAETLPYFKDKDQDLIHAAIGKSFHTYMHVAEKMPADFIWAKQVIEAYDRAHDIVANACYAPAERQDDECNLTKQFIIKLDELTEHLNR